IVDKRKINNIAKGKRPSHKNSFKTRRVLEKRVTPNILKEYKDFEHLFAEVVDD
ncbi:hypothetical protein CC77DRAFT_951459, partial [Alternaria alternata]